MVSLDVGNYVNFLIDIFKLLLQILLVIFGIAILYHFGNPHTKRFRLINAGTLFATIVIFLATKGLSIYFSNFNVYNKIYGSIGSLLITLVWLNIVSYVLLLALNYTLKPVKSKKDMVRGFKALTFLLSSHHRLACHLTKCQIKLV